jgi:hypothetical protein
MITYTKQPAADKLIPVYNNSILEFSSSLSSPTHAILTNSINSYELKIVPSPIGVFWVNLKYLYKSFFTFNDNVEPNYGKSPVLTFVDDNSFKTVELYLTIYNSTTNEQDDFSINLFRSVLQSKVENLDLLFQSISPIQYTYFKGYPFDVQFWMPSSITNGMISRLPNSLIGLTVEKGINRVWGDTGDENSAVSAIGIGTNIIYYITKTVDCDGIYLKWLASDGSWRYWLFNQKQKETINTKSLGQLYNDWNETADTISPTVEVGKTSEQTIKLHATALEPYERENIHTIIESPKVFLYTGTKGVEATLNDWLEVELVNNSMITNNYGRNGFNIDIDIRLNRNTMTMV